MPTFCSACGQLIATGAKVCGQCGAPTTSPAEKLPYASHEKQPGHRCKTCDVGLLRLEKRYRMSTPFVAIGYILLVPSILGIIFSLLVVFMTGLGGSRVGSASRDIAATNLRQAGVAEPIVQKVIASQQITAEDDATLTPAEKGAIQKAESSITAQETAAGAATVLGGGIGIFFAVVSFICGLLGWLLVMKKKVLFCSNCSAVVPAS
jgi:hypothetical protein